MRKSRFWQLLAAASLGACGGVDDEGWALDDGGAEVAVATQGLWEISAGTVSTHRTWYSGDTTQLSTWNSVDCVGNVGGDDEVLSELIAYKEPSSNADNFVARLRITCREYATNGADQYAPLFGLDTTTTVFTGPNYRTPAEETLETPAAPNVVSVGVRLVINPNSYVKDVKLRYAEIEDDAIDMSSITTTGGATDYGGDEHTLDCPDQYALTGAGVRYSLNSGKIRQFRIYCRELEHD